MANKLFRNLKVEDEELHLFAPPSADELPRPTPSALPSPGNFVAPSPEELANIVTNKKPMLTKEGLISGAIEALPAGGALAGGTIGTPLGPLGAAGGAALGAGTGAAIKEALLKLRGVPRSTEETALEIAQQTALGGAGEAAAGPIVKGISAATSKLAPLLKTGLKPGAEEIAQASAQLGIQPTAGMLSSSPLVQGLESSLEQSPSIAGSLVRSETGPIRQGLKTQAERVLDEAAAGSAYEVGEKVKNDLISTIHKEYDPISASYDKLAEGLKTAPVKPEALQSFSDKIKEVDIIKLTPGSSWAVKANQYSKWIKNAKTVEDLKTLRTLVGKDVDSASEAGDFNSLDVLRGIYDDLTKLQERSLQTAAIEMNQGSKEAGESVFKQLSETGSKYKTLLGKLKDVSSQAGIKGARSVGKFIDKVEAIPSERIGEKLFNTENYQLLKVMQENFPDEFQQLRQLRIAQIYKRSINPQGEVSPLKLVNQIKNMTPESVEMIFGGEKSQMLEAIKTVSQAAPRMMGPSGTPQGLEYLNLLNPLMQMREAGRYATYKAASIPGEVSKAVESIGMTASLPGVQSVLGQTIKVPIEQVGEYSNMIKENEPSKIERAKKLTQLHKKGELAVKAETTPVSIPTLPPRPMKTPQPMPNRFEGAADFAKRQKVQDY